MEKWLKNILLKDNSIHNQNEFYKLMVEYLGEEILVTDSDGVVIFANPVAATLIDIPVDELIGKNTKDLVAENHIDISSSERALEAKRTVSILQKLRSGRTVLATSIPIFDDDFEKINMVITTSKDVDEINKLLMTIEAQQQQLKLRDETLEGLLNEIFESIGFIISDELMVNVKETLLRIAPLDVTVLIDGETGVGKDVAARTIHRFSNRKNKPFVRISCGMMPENLVESILFGYDSGAFTGAEKGGKQGKLELADGGTLFLDEISEMPLSLQVKLLEFIQNRTFSRVGGTSTHSVDVRIIAATNVDLKSLCNSGKFRKDLYFRLNTIPIHIPPLRERRRDVSALTKCFLSNLNTKYNSSKTISPSAMHLLMTYSWPGNVRELEHVLERIYVITEETRIEREIVMEVLNDSMALSQTESGFNTAITAGIPLKEARQKFENQIVKEAYTASGSTYKAASLLGVDQSTVARILKRQKQN